MRSHGRGVAAPPQPELSDESDDHEYRGHDVDYKPINRDGDAYCLTCNRPVHVPDADEERDEYR